MKKINTFAALAALLIACPGLAAGTPLDAASLEVGSGRDVYMLRLGLQSKWNQRWFESNGTHLSGYWDSSFAQWRGSAYRGVPGTHQNISNIGFTPVFRFEADDRKGWYAELGIGVNLLSHLYNNDGHHLSTAFQFGDHLGVGYVFGNRWELALKLQHFSNCHIKRPNDGVNFAVVKLARPF